jgi:hypothetical protein
VQRLQKTNTKSKKPSQKNNFAKKDLNLSNTEMTGYFRMKAMEQAVYHLNCKKKIPSPKNPLKKKRCKKTPKPLGKYQTHRNDRLLPYASGKGGSVRHFRHPDRDDCWIAPPSVHQFSAKHDVGIRSLNS